MSQNEYVYIGTVRNGGSIKGNGQGVYCLQELQDRSVVEKDLMKADSISFICKGNHNVLYGVSETKDFTGLNGSGGGVVCVRCNEDGSLSLLNSSISYGYRPCYISMSDSGKYVLVANHGSHTTVTCSYQKKEDGSYGLVRGFDESSVALFALNEDGSIGCLCDLFKMEGKGYWCHGGGQSTSHIHCVIEHGGTVVACNRGTDEIAVGKLDEGNGKLIFLSKYHVRNGYAPRHAVFHPSLPFVYVVFENYPCAGVYQLHEDGTLSEKQIIGTMEPSFYDSHPLPVFEKRHAEEKEANTCAMMDHALPMGSDLHVTSDGRILYVSSRHFTGQGMISVYRIDEDGTLHLLQVKRLSGSDIRGFTIDEKQRRIIAGIMDHNVIVSVPYEEDGRLMEEKSLHSVSAPSCIVI